MMRCRSFVIAALLATVLFVSPGLAAEQAGFVGMQIQGMSVRIAEAMGRAGSEGVLVRDVALGGPADKAGFKRGDLILEFGGKTIKTFEDLVGEVKKLKADDAAEVRVIRHGGEVQLTLVAGKWPKSWQITKNSFAAIGAAGLTLASLTEQVRKRFGLRWGSTGVVVTIIDASVASKIDLKRGELIHQINQEPVWEPRKASGLIFKALNVQKKTVLLLVEGVDGFRYVILPLTLGEEGAK